MGPGDQASEGGGVQWLLQSHGRGKVCVPVSVDRLSFLVNDFLIGNA